LPSVIVMLSRPKSLTAIGKLAVRVLTEVRLELRLLVPFSDPETSDASRSSPVIGDEG